MNEPTWLKHVPRDIIQTVAATHRLDWHLVAAIVMTESGGNCWKPRHEPAYQWIWHPRELAEKVGVSYPTMLMLQRSSWGPMQVMGAVAYELGLPQDMVPTQLCLPHIGIEYGCRLLAKLFQKYNEESDVIAAYNAGSARIINGMYANQKYVDKVHGYLSELRKLI